MVLNPTYQSYLCDDANLDKPVWMTQARKLISKKTRKINSYFNER